jgi:hypothetical protein
MSEIAGGCRCTCIRYRVKLDKLPNVYACHCLDCQTWTGSAFSLQFFLPENLLEVDGDPALFELASPTSGRISRQRACPMCFARIYNTNSSRPGYVTLRAGTLDRSNELRVVAHIWTKRKLVGIDIPHGVPSWQEGAPPPDFVTALTRE